MTLVAGGELHLHPHAARGWHGDLDLLDVQEQQGVDLEQIEGGQEGQEEGMSERGVSKGGVSQGAVSQPGGVYSRGVPMSSGPEVGRCRLTL